MDVCPLSGAGQYRSLPFLLPPTFGLRMISSMVVLAPHGEVAKTLPVVRLATHKLIVSVYAVVGVELLATTLGGKTHGDRAAKFCADQEFAETWKLCHRHYRGGPSLSIVFCPPTLIPSSNNMISLTNLPSTPAGQVPAEPKRTFLRTRNSAFSQFLYDS